MAEKSEHGAYGTLLYPELLSKEGLLEILKQRYITQSGLEDMDKDELIQLYYKYVIPLPQRKYRMNRRGKEMTKKQIRMAKKRKSFTGDEDGHPPKKKSAEETYINSRFSSSFDPSSKAQNRLKPPPSCIDFNKKTIKLGSGSSTKQASPVDQTETDSLKTKKKINLISFSSTPKIPAASSVSPTSKSDVSPSNTSVNKTVKLINKHLHKSDSTNTEEKTVTEAAESSNNNSSVSADTSSQKSSSSASSQNEVTPKKKIKLKRIGWP